MAGLHNRNLFSHSFGAWKSEIRLPAWSDSDEDLPPGLQMVAISPYTHIAFLQCIRVKRECTISLVSLLIRGLSPSNQGPILMTTANSNDLAKILFPNTITL
jgi:hypothetical protein